MATDVSLGTVFHESSLSAQISPLHISRHVKHEAIFHDPANNLPIKGNSISLGIRTRYVPLVSQETLLSLVVWRREKQVLRGTDMPTLEVVSQRKNFALAAFC